MKNRPKKFINVPEYPGGKKAFKEYIRKNLIYPEEALKKKVQGVVYIVAEVDDNGRVYHVGIEKGIGAGCDEEAVRLIKNIQYYAVRNKGVRVKTKKRFRIEFTLPKQQPLLSDKKIKYNLTGNKSQETSKAPGVKTYSYSIKFKSNQ